MSRYLLVLISLLFLGLTPAPSPRLTWTYPPSKETPDLVFNLYCSEDIRVPLRQWKRLNAIPGYERSARLKQSTAQRFYVLTASNHFGESDPAR